MSGLELVPHVHSLSPDTVVVMVSGNQDIEFAIKAARVDAFDYMTKPIDLRHVEASVERALNHCNLLKEKRLYKEQIENLLQQRTAEVNWLANFDPVTQLPNRALFEDRLTQAVALAKATNQSLGVLFISLDQFKKVNDSLGHGPGDTLLREFAERLKSCIGKSDTVARFGSDEFALLRTQIDDTNDVIETIGSLSQLLKFAFDLPGHELFGTASVGVSLFPLDGEDCQTLLKMPARRFTKPSARWRELPVFHRRHARVGNEPSGARIISAGQFKTKSSWSTTSREFRSTRWRLPASKTWCAGSIRSSASFRHPNSFHSPKTRG